MKRLEPERSTAPWSRARRFSAAVFLLGVTAAVATLRGPARGSEDVAPAPKSADAPTAARSSPPLYFGGDWVAVIAFRPAAAARHAGFARILDPFLISKMLGLDLSDLKKLCGDTSRPGFLRLRAEDLEWITACQR